MDSVLFRWVKRSTYDNIRIKDPATLYFIKDEHVLYKGTQEYGGVQNISYSTDEDGNYILTIINGDGSTEILPIAASSRVEKALDDLASHIATRATDETFGHVKLTDTISAENPTTIINSIAVTPKAVVDYILGNPNGLVKLPTVADFPIIGDESVIYYAKNNNMFYIYDEGSYKMMTPAWSNIKIIRGDTAINA